MPYYEVYEEDFLSSGFFNAKSTDSLLLYISKLKEYRKIHFSIEDDCIITYDYKEDYDGYDIEKCKICGNEECSHSDRKELDDEEWLIFVKYQHTMGYLKIKKIKITKV
jgi:hypothetical protein